MLLILLLDTPDAPSMSLKVDNEPFDGELAVLNAGQMIEVSCTADEGNPQTVLTLTKDGSTFGPEPRSEYIAHTFMVTAEDSGSVLGCKAENENNWSAESQTVELNVQCKYIHRWGFCVVLLVTLRPLDGAVSWIEATTNSSILTAYRLGSMKF